MTRSLHSEKRRECKYVETVAPMLTFNRSFLAQFGEPFGNSYPRGGDQRGEVLMRQVGMQADPTGLIEGGSEVSCLLEKRPHEA